LEKTGPTGDKGLLGNTGPTGDTGRNFFYEYAFDLNILISSI
jgi:hypothetical protein